MRWIATAALTLIAALASAQVDGGDEALLAQNRREIRSLKVERERLVRELVTAWDELDRDEPMRGELAVWLAERAGREGSVRQSEASLGVVLARARELRQSMVEERVRIEAARGAGGALGGRWRLALDDVEGRLELVQNGAMVSGSYVRNDSRGLVIGYGGSGRVVLMLIDDGGDHYATLTGSEGEGDILEGTYLRSDLASGQPAQGEFHANR